MQEQEKFHALKFYVPYKKQQEFHDLGLTKKERMLFAGNRNGKTYCGGAEMAMHLTGEYPDWWMGRRWDRPIEAWAAGETSLACRDIVQKMLCGKPGIVAEQGSGMIPRAAVNWVKDVTSARGISNFYDTIHVKHISGGYSSLYFKTYEQGATKWQGASLDLIWFDEEPPEDVYAEGLARLGDRGGMAFMTFTPLQGKSKVVCRFTDIPDPFRATVTMTIDDALHMKPAERKALIASYLPPQVEASSRGVPT